MFKTAKDLSKGDIIASSKGPLTVVDTYTDTMTQEIVIWWDDMGNPPVRITLETQVTLVPKQN